MMLYAGVFCLGIDGRAEVVAAVVVAAGLRELRGNRGAAAYMQSRGRGMAGKVARSAVLNFKAHLRPGQAEAGS